MKAIRISAVIITLNEEKNIGRCLHSLQDLVDDIVVVDSFSSDQTSKICADYKVTFIQRAWEGYSSAKNYGNSIAKYDHILSIDADEVLSDELRESIRRVKSNMSCDAYYLQRITNYCGHWIKHCGWYPDIKLRLWNRNDAEWQGKIHESLVCNKIIRSGTLKGDLLHYSFHSIAEHIRTANKFSELSAEELANGDFKVNFIYHIILNPLYVFFRKYILQLGFLDGFHGFVICVISSFSNFLKYSKIKLKSRK
jgi:glycosyltransferase involved in cell wall biosynthesis